MQFAELDIKAGRNRRFRIYPIGDMHLEKYHFDEERFTKYVELIRKDPNSMWVFLGDAVEGRTPGMKFYDIGTIRPEFKDTDDFLPVLRQEFNRLFSPLKKRPGVVIKGNHDEYMKYAGIARDVAEASGGAYLGVEGIFRANVDLGGKTGYFTGYARHVLGGGTSHGGAINAAVRSRGIANVDSYFFGHVHKQDSLVVPLWEVPRRKGGKPTTRDQLFVIAPAFLEGRALGREDYAARKGYEVTDNRLFVYEVDLETRKIISKEIEL